MDSPSTTFNDHKFDFVIEGLESTPTITDNGSATSKGNSREEGASTNDGAQDTSSREQLLNTEYCKSKNSVAAKQLASSTSFETNTLRTDYNGHQQRQRQPRPFAFGNRGNRPKWQFRPAYGIAVEDRGSLSPRHRNSSNLEDQCTKRSSRQSQLSFVHKNRTRPIDYGQNHQNGGMANDSYSSYPNGRQYYRGGPDNDKWRQPGNHISGSEYPKYDSDIRHPDIHQPWSSEDSRVFHGRGRGQYHFDSRHSRHGVPAMDGSQRNTTENYATPQRMRTADPNISPQEYAQEFHNGGTLDSFGGQQTNGGCMTQMNYGHSGFVPRTVSGAPSMPCGTSWGQPLLDESSSVMIIADGSETHSAQTHSPSSTAQKYLPLESSYLIPEASPRNTLNDRRPDAVCTHSRQWFGGNRNNEPRRDDSQIGSSVNYASRQSNALWSKQPLMVYAYPQNQSNQYYSNCMIQPVNGVSLSRLLSIPNPDYPNVSSALISYCNSVPGHVLEHYAKMQRYED